MEHNRSPLKQLPAHTSTIITPQKQVTFKKTEKNQDKIDQGDKNDQETTEKQGAKDSNATVEDDSDIECIVLDDDDDDEDEEAETPTPTKNVNNIKDVQSTSRASNIQKQNAGTSKDNQLAKNKLPTPGESEKAQEDKFIFSKSESIEITKALKVTLNDITDEQAPIKRKTNQNETDKRKNNETDKEKTISNGKVKDKRNNKEKDTGTRKDNNEDTDKRKNNENITDKRKDNENTRDKRKNNEDENDNTRNNENDNAKTKMNENDIIKSTEEEHRRVRFADIAKRTKWRKVPSKKVDTTTNQQAAPPRKQKDTFKATVTIPDDNVKDKEHGRPAAKTDLVTPNHMQSNAAAADVMVEDEKKKERDEEMRKRIIHETKQLKVALSDILKENKKKGDIDLPSKEKIVEATKPVDKNTTKKTPKEIRQPKWKENMVSPKRHQSETSVVGKPCQKWKENRKMSKKHQKETKTVKKSEEEINLVDSDDWDSDFEPSSNNNREDEDKEDDDDTGDWRQRQQEKADRRWNEIIFGAPSKPKEKSKDQTAKASEDANKKSKATTEAVKKPNTTVEQKKTADHNDKGTEVDDAASENDIWIDSGSDDDDIQSHNKVTSAEKSKTEKAKGNKEGNDRNKKNAIKTSKREIAKQKAQTKKQPTQNDVQKKPFIPDKDGNY